jgi:hypothetical protein
MEKSNTALNTDKTIKHYHVFVRENPKQLHTSTSKKIYDIKDYFFPLI